MGVVMASSSWSVSHRTHVACGEGGSLPGLSRLEELQDEPTDPAGVEVGEAPAVVELPR